MRITIKTLGSAIIKIIVIVKLDNMFIIDRNEYLLLGKKFEQKLQLYACL